MKVVIFCGGLGMRLREYSETIPKPMVPVGYRPILWHVMRYYAHFGHTDFILCLGYKGDSIKKYFLEYDETVSNDFVMSEGGRDPRPHVCRVLDPNPADTRGLSHGREIRVLELSAKIQEAGRSLLEFDES